MEKTQQHMKLSVSIGLLESLRPRHPNRFSRSEAFVDLVCRVLGTTDNSNINCIDTAISSDSNPAVLSHTTDNLSTENQKAVNDTAFGSHFGRHGDLSDNGQGKTDIDLAPCRQEKLAKTEESDSDNSNADESCNMTSTVKKPGSSQCLRQFDTNYTQLASFWKWNRETVHTFLRTLETEGLLLYEQTGKRLSIYIDI